MKKIYKVVFLISISFYSYLRASETLIIGLERPVREGWKINSRLGSDYGGTNTKRPNHRGIDIELEIGTPVYAAASGEVIRAGWEDPSNKKKGFGKRIWIQIDPERDIKMVYAHLKEIFVNPGENVVAGQIIGLGGNTGHVVPGEGGDGSHLHFEITKGCFKGTPLNPEDFLPPAPWKKSGEKEVDNYSLSKSNSPYVSPQYPKDPNIKMGSEGYVSPGEEVYYTVEFENIGEGIAYGVYITDILDENLDDSFLIVDDFVRIDENKNEWPADFTWSYNPETRMITVYVDNDGEVLSKHGGKFTIRARVRSDVSEGTVITNYATVYFPNVMEVTKTNTIVSVVPYRTQLIYQGDISVEFSDIIKLEAKLIRSDEKVVENQIIEFSINNTTWTARTDPTGEATIYSEMNLLPGSYLLDVTYTGDGYYYLPAKISKDIEIVKEGVVLSTPSVTLIYPEVSTITVTMVDNDGSEILFQEEEPKKVYLECYNKGRWILLDEGILKDDKVDFEFSMPERPESLELPLRVRFDGDSKYRNGEARGKLTIIDVIPPEISITSPEKGKTYIAKKDVIKIDYEVTDDLDPEVWHKAYLKDLEEGTTIEVRLGDEIEPLEIDDGFWEMVVEARDWAGNYSSRTSGAFEVIHDILPPRTTVQITNPKFQITDKTFITSQTGIILTAEDDLVEVGDGIGLGVEETRWKVEGGSWKIYTGTFTIVGEDGIYYVDYYSVDVIGNTELTKRATYYLDNTPPVTSIATGIPQYKKEEKIYIALHTPIELEATDPVVNEVASGLKEIYYSIDNQPFAIYNSPFTLGEGIHEVKYYAIDNLGNIEEVKNQIYYVDGTPPKTSINIGTPQYEIEGRIYISSETEITLSAIDPIVKDVSSGVQKVQFRVESLEWRDYTGSFTLREGIRLVEYRSIDNVDNTEEIKSITLYVDETPPETSLSIEGIKYTKVDGIYVTSQTTFTLTAEDPIVNEVSSGVKETKYRILSSTGVYQNWSVYEPNLPDGSQVNIIGPDGVYTIEYFSIDNVENREEIYLTTYSSRTYFS